MNLNMKSKKMVGFTAITGLVLAFIFILSAGASAYILRENSIKDHSNQLTNLTVILSEHAAQTIFSANTALDSLVDAVKSANIQSESDYREFASKKDSFLSLEEKIKSNSIIDVASYIANDGTVINFSRSFPPPRINLAERDYFQYLRNHNSSETFYSTPARNKWNEKWVFYLAKQINNSSGEFMGVALIGVSAEVFSKFYERIGVNLGKGASLVLLKNDRTLLTSWPFIDDQIGTKVSSEVVEAALNDPSLMDKVIPTDAPTSLRNNERAQRILSFRAVPGYPLLVGAIASEDLYLEDWRKSVYGILYTTILSLILIAVGAKLLIKSYKANLKNEHLANHDLLTKLPNRLLFADRLQQILGLAKRNGTKFALVFIDLDNLKKINDIYSHFAGDTALQESASRILHCLRSTDTVARIGGDEFVLLLPNIDSVGSALVICEKVRAALLEPIMINGLSVVCSASIGIAIYPDHGDGESKLTENADKAMYRAKFNGGNRIQIYSADL